jgi:hypothetical protein
VPQAVVRWPDGVGVNNAKTRDKFFFLLKIYILVFTKSTKDNVRSSDGDFYYARENQVSKICSPHF